MPTYNKLPKETKKYLERELRQYKENKKRLQQLLSSKKANMRVVLFLENRINNIEAVIRQLDSFEKEVFDMIFIKRYDWLYCKEIKNIGKYTYYNILNKIIYMLAKEEGEI